MKHLTLFVALLLHLSCNTLNVPAGTPRCIQDKIRAIQQAAVRNPPGSVWQYTYNGRTVYFIPSYCCDQTSELYDEQCNLICRPDGGITGRGDGQCPDFFEARTNEKLIWKDERQGAEKK